MESDQNPAPEWDSSPVRPGKEGGSHPRRTPVAKMSGPSPLLRARCCVQSRGSWEGECTELGLEGQNDLVQGPLHSFKKH